MILLNIAEDLKEDCKMTVSPIKDEKKTAKKGQKKPTDMEGMEAGAHESREKREDFVAITEEDLDDDDL